MKIVFFLLMVLAELIASSSQILLKKSAQKEYPSVIREYLNILVISGYSLLVLAMIISIFCYDGLGYMGVVVLEPMGYIIVMFLSRFFFKEKFTPCKLIGMIIIMSGIALFFASSR